MLQEAIDLCKSALEYIGKKKEFKQETKLRISVLMDDISSILLDTATNFEKDIYPHFNCSLLEKMVNHLHFFLMDYMPQNQVDELRKTLMEATKVEEQFVKRHEENVISSLKSAAGEFKAMSLMLKI